MTTRPVTLPDQLLVSTPGIAEAPTWVGDELWFTDLMSGVLRLRADGSVEIVVEGRRGVGGLVPHASGGVIASGRSLIHVAETGAVTTMSDRPPGTTGFNDLHTSPDGDVLAGVLRYRPLAGEEPRPGALLVLRNGVMRELVAGPAWPNGIGTSPTGDAIYLADFATGQVLVVTDSAPARVLATLEEGHADGLAVDAEGRIWVATGPGRTVVVLSPEGVVEERFGVAAEFVASLALPPAGGACVLAVAGLRGGSGGLLAVDLPVVAAPVVAATAVLG